ncbi:unnamed protein product, partial [Rotaria magnacalcarata]
MVPSAIMFTNAFTLISANEKVNARLMGTTGLPISAATNLSEQQSLRVSDVDA